MEAVVVLEREISMREGSCGGYASSCPASSSSSAHQTSPSTIALNLFCFFFFFFPLISLLHAPLFFSISYIHELGLARALVCFSDLCPWRFLSARSISRIIRQAASKMYRGIIDRSMLEVLRSPGSKAADQLHVVDAGFPTSTDQCGSGGDEFMLDGENLLDYIDFTCCDVPSFFDADGDILPDLETELLAEFEDHERGGGKPPDDVASSSQGDHHHHKEDEERLLLQVEEEEGQTAQTKKSGSGDEVSLASAVTSTDTSKSSSASAEKKKKKKRSKNSNGKRKVDWTPDLHRRFVQAVEQLGIDKAVPSRILEIMGIEGLTRHNIASHLQKYRSHRKHLMAQEAEAASWAKKRQMYAAAPGAPRLTKDMPPAAAAPWVVPTTIRFPSPPFGRPLHVWGHPSTALEATAAPMLPVWPRHLAPVDRAYWHQPQYNGARKWGPMTQGTPCVPPPIMPRFPTPPVPGTRMPHPMYRPPMPPPPQITSSNLATLQLRLDAHPSKESIDAAIGDVLAKPWLPLPLGLKPPSLDSVMSELHKQGIPKIPPSS